MKVVFIITVASIASCSAPPKKELRSIKEIDSLLAIQNAKYEKPKEEFTDTVGLYKAPIKVISAKLSKEDYSDKRSITITYKNTSDKNIEGIRFHWMTSGTWGVEDVGRYSSLKTDELLKAGKSHTRTWQINSENKKACFAWPHEVVYADGTRWLLDKP